MESSYNSSQDDRDNLPEIAYRKYYSLICNYIAYRIDQKWYTEDMAQDVFIRLLEYKNVITPATVKQFLFTIARNLLTDYVRRSLLVKMTPATEEFPPPTNETEEEIFTNDILGLELKKVESFPRQRKLVYTMSRYEEKTSLEISGVLGLSKKTVENHLLAGRKQIRKYLKECI